MELKIISPESTQTYTIIWLELNTRSGNFIIQRGHAPMVVSLAPDKEIIFCLSNGKQESLIPTSGIAEITRKSTTILLNQKPV